MSEAKPISVPTTIPKIPANVRLGEQTVLSGEQAFRRFYAERDPAVLIGSHCHLDGVQFALGKNALLHVGDYTYAAHLILLVEQEVRIGSYVIMSFNVVIADTDFHPIDPALRLADAIAVSPLGRNRPRPPITTAPVVIDDNVWIGANVTILKGVHIGAGAFIEPGSMVTRDVPPRARMMGNPAQQIGEV
jgi:acetyltransferase-like isoleucine patch superfamily enzyme